MQPGVHLDPILHLTAVNSHVDTYPPLTASLPAETYTFSFVYVKQTGHLQSNTPPLLTFGENDDIFE